MLEPGFKIGEIDKQGQRVWDITFWSSGRGFGTGFAIADGYLFAASNTTSNTGTTQQSIVDTYFVPAVVAIIAVVVIIGVLVIVMLRKRR